MSSICRIFLRCCLLWKFTANSTGVVSIFWSIECKSMWIYVLMHPFLISISFLFIYFYSCFVSVNLPTPSSPQCIKYFNVLKRFLHKGRISSDLANSTDSSDREIQRQIFHARKKVVFFISWVQRYGMCLSSLTTELALELGKESTLKQK